MTICLNGMPYLREAVDSVLGQDDVSLQYVIQDGGSSDGSVEYLLSIQDARVSVSVEMDDGPSDALNKGFRRLNVDVFGFLNSDDALEPGALAYVSQFFESNTSTCVLQGSGFIVDERVGSVKRFVPSRTTTQLMRWDVSNMMQPSLFFRTSCLPQPPFNDMNRTSWDGELLMKLLEDGHSWRRSCRSLSRFRLHRGSISGSGRLENQYLIDKSSYLNPGVNRRHGRALFQPLMRLATKSEALVWAGFCTLRSRARSLT